MKKRVMAVIITVVLSTGLMSTNQIFAANQQDNKTSEETNVGEEETTDDTEVTAKAMHRLYNPNSGEHFYTASDKEKNYLASIGWKYEGIGWYAPDKKHGEPVYRLYNKNGGEHHYTVFGYERQALVKAGWEYEGVGWYSYEALSKFSTNLRYPYPDAVPLYRQYNPNAFSNNHNYTGSIAENNWLVSLGWKSEGIGWYGIEENDVKEKSIESYEDFGKLEENNGYLQYFGTPDKKNDAVTISMGSEEYTGDEYLYNHVKLVDTGLSGTASIVVIPDYGGHALTWIYDSGTEEIVNSIIKNVMQHGYLITERIYTRNELENTEHVYIRTKDSDMLLTFDYDTRKIQVQLAGD